MNLVEFGPISQFIKTLPPWMLLGAGFLTGWIRSFWDFVYGHSIGYVTKKIKVNLVIEESENSEVFTWLSCWMESLLATKKINSLRIGYEREGDSSGFTLHIGYGTYYTWWKKRLIQFESSKKEMQGAGGSRPILRTIEITIWGTRDRAKILHAIEESRLSYERMHPAKISYFVYEDGYWEGKKIKPRAIDTLYLPDTQLEDIVSDFNTFFASKERYHKLGIPWRKGYLFYGPPGTGKTTGVHVLGSHFNMPIYYLNLSGTISSARLREQMNTLPDPCILLIEDVDSISAAKKREDSEGNEKKEDLLQTRDLLNCIDGIIASEGRIMIMTSNHPDKLDEALIRAGRVDRKFYFDYAKELELEKFHRVAAQYYPVPEYSIFRKSLPENCTIADAQNEVFKCLNV